MARGSRTVRTDQAREVFLTTLARACNVTAACQAAGIGRQTAYTWREDDTAFAAAWTAAIDEAVDRLEAEAWRRGVEGVDKPVTFQGEITASFKEYSDRILEVLLKAHRPEKYIERLRTENTHALTVNIQGAAADL